MLRGRFFATFKTTVLCQRAFPESIQVGRGTVANILKEHGLEPAPERKRKTTWKEFLTQHREVIVAADFSPSRLGLAKA